jgi:hypothetical protein
MSRDVEEVAYVELAGQSLVSVKTFSIAVADPGTIVKTMTRRRRAIGRTNGVPDFNITMTVAMLNPAEVDWRKWLRDKDERMMAYERSASGTRVQLRDCVLEEINEQYDADGNAELSLTITALDEKDE